MRLVVLFIAVPLAVAFATPLLATLSTRLSRLLTWSTLVGGVVLAALTLPTVARGPVPVILGGWKPPFGIVLMADVLSILLVLTVCLVAALALLFQWGEGKEKPASFDMLVLLLVTGANGMILTGDLFNLFVFLEIMTVSAIALIA